MHRRETNSNISTVQHLSGCQGDLQPPVPLAAKRDISKYETMWNRVTAAATTTPPAPYHRRSTQSAAAKSSRLAALRGSMCVGDRGGVERVFLQNYNLLANIITLRHYRGHAGPCRRVFEGQPLQCCQSCFN